MPPAADEEQIRQRAYQIWEREGRPIGRDGEHWITAKLELAREAQPAAKKAPAKRTRASESAGENPETENSGKTSKKSRGTSAVREPPKQ